MPNNVPQLKMEGTVTPNGEAAQVYFTREYTLQPGFPLVPGRGFVSLLVPQRAVVVLPADEAYSLPLRLTVYPPEQYRVQVDSDTPEDLPSNGDTEPSLSKGSRKSVDVDTKRGGDSR